MNSRRELKNMEELLDCIADAGRNSDEVSVDDILNHVGRRSFGPILLLAGLLTLAPVISGIPGIPVLGGLLVMLCSVQLLLRRDHFWFPQWILRRSIGAGKVCKAVGWMRKPARFVDRLLKPRFAKLTDNGGTYLVAVVCTAIALVMPLMELVPFSANGAGIALTAFGLALITHDGLVALIALVVTLLTVAGVAYLLVGM